MTDQRLDTEQTIRDWLSDSVPDRAPASLRETLEDVTSEPAGHARPWPRRGYGLRFAGRVAAALAILAVVGSGVYALSLRSSSPASPTTTPSAAPGSPTGAMSPIPQTAAPRPTPSVEQLPGSSWRMVSGALPQMMLRSPSESPVFAATTGSSAGFLAFVPSTAGPSFQTEQGILIKLQTSVFQSGDGITWTERAVLPSDAATVTSVASSGGQIVAVGWTGNASNSIPMAWTSSDLTTWQATVLPAPDGTDAFGVAAGPAGFLAWGYATTGTEFWISTDGATWRSVATSGLPADGAIDALYGVSDGWVIRGPLSDRAAVWHSPDGRVWTQTYTGPAGYASPSGTQYSAMGPIAKAPGGGYVSFGDVGVASGQPSTPRDLLLWTSPDMTNWTPSTRVPAPGWMTVFAAGPGGYVGGGSQPAVTMAGVTNWGSFGVWTSPDGRTWQAVAGIPATPPIEVLAVVGNGSHVVVVCVDQAGNLELLVGDG